MGSGLRISDLTALPFGVIGCPDDVNLDGFSG